MNLLNLDEINLSRELWCDTFRNIVINSVGMEVGSRFGERYSDIMDFFLNMDH